MVAQPSIPFPVVGCGGELYAGSGAQEEGGCRANIDFSEESCNVDATQQNTIEWVCCGISPTPLETHIDHTHAQKVGDKEG